MEAPLLPAEAGLQITGRVRSRPMEVLWKIFIVLTGGLAWLVGQWLPVHVERLLSSSCALEHADHVIIRHEHGAEYAEEIKTESADNGPAAIYLGSDLEASHQTVRFFMHRMQRYVCNYTEGAPQFRVAPGLESGHSFRALQDVATKGVSVSRRLRSVIYGPNTIDVEVPGYLVLLYREVLNPFYIFQAFAIILWVFETYYQYSAILFAMTIVAAGLSLFETRRNLVRLRSMVHMTGTVHRVHRATDGSETVEHVDVATLLPGDVFEIPQGRSTLYCDAVLLTGACVVNESMLTGESIPVSKTPIPTAGAEAVDEYSPDVHKAHTLFCGTHVLYTRTTGVRALVVRTGYSTSKGELIRSFLFPRRTRFRLIRDSIIFVGILFFFGMIGLVYSVVVLDWRGVDRSSIAIKSLDIITLIVPPALPVALAVGIIWALYILRKSQIYCTSPPRVNECGKIKICCFDKTGTLTEEGLTLWGVHPAEGKAFSSVLTTAAHLHGWMIAAFATCHSLVHLQVGDDNDPPTAADLPPGPAELPYAGDPMEVELFKLIGWTLKDDCNTLHSDTLVQAAPQGVLGAAEPAPPAFVLLKRFPFLSQLRRMVVLAGACADGGSGARGPVFVFVKGAPEDVRALCRGETVPADFDERVREYSQQGFRLIGVAAQQLDISWEQARDTSREEIERNLRFLGLVVLQNRLKPETPPIISQLRAARLRTVMVTGDNIFTACSVARECGLVASQDQFAQVTCVPSAKGGYELQMAMMENDAFVSEALPTGLEFVPLLDSESALARSTDHCMRVALAVTGKEFALIAEHLPNELKRLAVCGSVFARMSPDQKTQLIHTMQEVGYCVCMCGDGANDCGALQAADVGVSLSEAEASVAAPFTSHRPDISCIPIIIREGRSAIATSFSVFKYIVAYSFVEFITATILYYIASNLSDNQYIYIDFPVVATVLLIARTPSYPTLAIKRPIGSLLSPLVLASLAGQILIQMAFQVGMYFYLQTQWFYVPLHINPDAKNIECYENTTLFLFANFQYIFLALAFTLNYPFRQPIYYNVLFVVVISIIFAFNAYITLKQDHWIANPLKLVELPSTTFRVALFFIALCNGLVTLAYEYSLNTYPAFQRLVKRLRPKRKHKNEYKNIALTVFRTKWPSRLFTARGT
eukprot:m.22053 g.22053  ORF g.22053 m.22053 type:complete len:1155 (-) comp8219_c0_seq1:45-3509(-)